MATQNISPELLAKQDWRVLRSMAARDALRNLGYMSLGSLVGGGLGAALAARLTSPYTVFPIIAGGVPGGLTGMLLGLLAAHHGSTKARVKNVRWQQAFARRNVQPGALPVLSVLTGMPLGLGLALVGSLATVAAIGSKEAKSGDRVSQTGTVQKRD